MKNQCLLLAVLLTLGAPTVFAHGVPIEDIEALRNDGNVAYIWLGAKHMVTGYDHLMFLFGVVFFLTRFMDIVKFITAFTIGHSITLTLGTLLGIGQSLRKITESRSTKSQWTSIWPDAESNWIADSAARV